MLWSNRLFRTSTRQTGHQSFTQIPFSLRMIRQSCFYSYLSDPPNWQHASSQSFVYIPCSCALMLMALERALLLRAAPACSSRTIDSPTIPIALEQQSTASYVGFEIHPERPNIIKIPTFCDFLSNVFVSFPLRFDQVCSLCISKNSFLSELHICYSQVSYS